MKQFTEQELDRMFDLTEKTVEGNYYGTQKFGISREKTNNGYSVMTNAIVLELETLRDKMGENAFDKKFNKNPYILIAKATKIAKGREFVKSTQYVEAIDENTHKKVKDVDGTVLKTLPGKEYITGKNFYDNIIKGNGLSEEFRRAAQIGVYGKKSKSENNNLLKTDAISIRYENFDQGVDYWKVKIDGPTMNVKINLYQGKYRTIVIAEEVSSGGVFIFNSIREAKDHYCID